MVCWLFPGKFVGLGDCEQPNHPFMEIRRAVLSPQEDALHKRRVRERKSGGLASIYNAILGKCFWGDSRIPVFSENDSWCCKCCGWLSGVLLKSVIRALASKSKILPQHDNKSHLFCCKHFVWIPIGFFLFLCGDYTNWSVTYHSLLWKRRIAPMIHGIDV